jgi:hypothetical protein
VRLNAVVPVITDEASNDGPQENLQSFGLLDSKLRSGQPRRVQVSTRLTVCDFVLIQFHSRLELCETAIVCLCASELDTLSASNRSLGLRRPHTLLTPGGTMSIDPERQNRLSTLIADRGVRCQLLTRTCIWL